MRRARAQAAVLVLAACAPRVSVPTAGEATEATEASVPDDLRALPYAGGGAPAEEADGPDVRVVLHDPARAVPGLNLFADDRSTCHALAMDGSERHRWVVPVHDQVEHFELLDGGRIVAVSVDQGVTLLERDSRVVWQVALAAHHDVRPTPRGTFLVPVHEERAYAGRTVRFDAVVELDGAGREVARWSAWEHLDDLRALHGPHPLDAPASRATDTVYDYHHLNAALEVGDAWLLCLRNVDLVVAVDRGTGVPRFGVGRGELDFPHDPSPVGGLERVLVFDNGYHRGHSRLVELDTATGAVTWQHRADPPASFHSRIRGACQPLAGGHLLVTESERGRVFELDASGARVWQLETRDGRRIYRMRRVPAERLAPAGR